MNSHYFTGIVFRKQMSATFLSNGYPGAGQDEFYIVYPSWSFLFSCNIVLLDSVYVFEGVYRITKGHSSGVKPPDFGFSVPLGFRSRRRNSFGKIRESV